MRAAPAEDVDAPDDDRHWKAGILYVSPDDPALFVQKRFVIGWTVNLGHPGGIAIGIALLALIAGSVVSRLLTGHILLTR